MEGKESGITGRQERFNSPIDKCTRHIPLGNTAIYCRFFKVSILKVESDCFSCVPRLLLVSFISIFNIVLFLFCCYTWCLFYLFAFPIYLSVHCLVYVSLLLVIITIIISYFYLFIFLLTSYSSSSSCSSSFFSPIYNIFFQLFF